MGLWKKFKQMFSKKKDRFMFTDAGQRIEIYGDEAVVHLSETCKARLDTKDLYLVTPYRWYVSKYGPTHIIGRGKGKPVT